MTRTPTDTPWTAEPAGDGYWRVVNSKSVVLASKCVEEEARLFAAAPELFEALDSLLAETLTEDLACGNELTEREAAANESALAAMEKALKTASI